MGHVVFYELQYIAIYFAVIRYCFIFVGLVIPRPFHRQRHVTCYLWHAGMVLASNGASSDLMRQMGFSKLSLTRANGAVDTLLESNLPCPALSLLFPQVLQQNMQIIDCMLPRRSAEQRRMVCCVDFTYLLPMLQSMKLHGEQGLVGAPFQMADLQEGQNRGCFQKLETEQGVRQKLVEKTKANRMPLDRFMVQSDLHSRVGPMGLTLVSHFINISPADCYCGVFHFGTFEGL